MADSSLFAPPTDAELKSLTVPSGSADLFAPPTDAELKMTTPDTRTTGEKWQDIFFGHNPKPDTRAPLPPGAYDQYKRGLPAALASGAMMLAPTPAGFVRAVTTLGAEGAAVGALEPADSTGQRVKNAALGGTTAAGLGAAGEGVAGMAGYLWPKAKALGAKLGEMATGVPATEIRTYAEQRPAIQKMMADADNSIPAAADTVREGFQQAIQNKKQALNQQISDAISASPKKASASIQPIINELEAQKGKLDPIYHGEALGAINGLIDKVKQGAAPEQYGKLAGTTNANYMNLIKQYLQGRASSSYAEEGQIFQSSPQAAQAAKAGAAKARQILNEMEPAVADANNQLAALHDIDNDLNANLIAPGKPDSALMAAGSGANQRNAMLLDQLGKATGTDMKSQAERLAAARTFTKPSWDPREGTGKSLYRAGVGAVLGGLTARGVGEPWYEGAVAGSVLSSPAALRLAIDSGRLPVSAIQKLGPLAVNALSRSAPMVAGSVVGGNQPTVEQAPNQIGDQSKALNRSPSRGPDAWAQAGVKNLGLPADQAQRLLADPRARDLLIQASSLTPGSKAFKAIQTQLQNFGGPR